MFLMRNAVLVGALPLALVSASTGIAAPQNPIAGKTQTSSTKTIVENVTSSKDHRILGAAIKAAGLIDTLSGSEPFTVFAPTDAAFGLLPQGSIDNLLKPENKAQLQTVLTYHVVSGTLTTRDLLEQIKAGGGKVQLKTVQGEQLTVEAKGRSIEIVDAKGETARVTIANLPQSNGVIHVVDAVLLP